MSSKDEYVYELKYLKINSFNNTELLDQNDIVDFMTYDGDIQSEIESDDSESLQKYYKKIFPTITQDLLKTNYEQIKHFSRLVSDKTRIAQCVNKILATDFKDSFIFNKQNLEDVTRILTYSFNEIKKSKISDLESAAKNINFQKYNFQKMYLNEEYIKNKNNNSRASSKRTTVSSNISEPKELNDEASEYDDKSKKRCYIDTKNILRSSDIVNDYKYNEKEKSKILLTMECFIYPKKNKDTGNIVQAEQLPIELIILLSKLRNVKCLILYNLYTF